MSRTRRRSQTAITAQQALEILESAISYCQLAGLKVETANRNGTLALFIAGCYYILTDNGTRAEFRFATISAQDTLETSAQAAQIGTVSARADC